MKTSIGWNRRLAGCLIVPLTSLLGAGCTTTGPGVTGAQNPTTIQVDPYYGREFQSAAQAFDLINQNVNKNYDAQSARAGQALQGVGVLLDLLNR
jgi:hypothetical protein